MINDKTFQVPEVSAPEQLEQQLLRAEPSASDIQNDETLMDEEVMEETILQQAAKSSNAAEAATSNDESPASPSPVEINAPVSIRNIVLYVPSSEP